ncbi:MAG: prenyltransferase/squalene oxidase repeat-containing protein [Anaerolineae bacterium]
MKKLVRCFILLVLSAALTLPVYAAASSADFQEAIDWLLTHQQRDGGFTTGFTEGSDLGATVEVVLAARAAGDDPRLWEPSPLDYLCEQVEAGAVTDAAGWSRVILGTLALGANPRDCGGVDAVAQLLATQETGSGQFGASLFAHAYAVLALHNAGVEPPQDAIDLLLETQTDDGAWAMNAADAVDTNTTALAVQALTAVGEEDVARRALPYFRAMQNDDGGFPWQKPSDYGTATDANSTAVVVQALIALGESPETWTAEDGTPLDALSALQDAESGGFQWQAAVPGPNVLATAQAVQALAGMSLVDLSAAAPDATAPVVESIQLPESGGFALTLGDWVILLGVGVLLTGVTLRKAAKPERMGKGS